ncbi:MAG: hypothetical protein ACREQZ_06535 [Woeseiaceae bacterium]
MITAEQITFYSHWLPALASGAYVASVTSKLEADKTSLEQQAVTQTFHVGGPRYALTGAEVYSCYPPPGQIGEFSNTLPHIVFDRCTLPWERSIDGSDPTLPHDPWLALVLLSDSDFSAEATEEARRVPPIVPTTVEKLIRPEANVIGPKLQLAEYERDTESCQTIDLPGRVFDAVMLKPADLQYLAHVREVETGSKETWSLLKEGKFSVVVCNRFPETQDKTSGEKDWGVVNTVLLVSLEGWNEVLKAGASATAEGKTYRLLVLDFWRFTCQGSGSFKSLMKELDDSRLLQRPPLQVRGGDAGAQDYLNKSFNLGFSALNHNLRNSDTTISWYRGPLTPMWYPRSMSYEDISCSDAALRYDPKSGTLDTSYAAAWQLGRLLALQDQAFAQALSRFRTDYQRWVRRTNAEALRRSAGNADGAAKAKTFAEKLGARTDVREWYADVLEEAHYLAQRGSSASHAQLEEPRIPTTVQNWLGQAMLLYGVPFRYLVPDEEMLPQESIRFFYLNLDWVNAMLQGACSVGRASETDELADQLLRARFFEVSEKLALELRASAKAAADQRRGDEANASLPAPVLHWPLSGFLMRSAAVESWIGLESTASGLSAAGQPITSLQILRMDRLAPDILLCIYNGKVTEIEAKQPPEGIHFGAVSKAGGYQKTALRKIDGDARTLGDKTVEVPTRGRTVSVAALAAKICEALKLTPRDLTSAEFAVQMIESPAKVTFKSTEASS